MKVLFIGGTGGISSACSRQAVEAGIDLYLLTRNKSWRGIPEGTHALTGDINDVELVRKYLDEHRFDVVVDFIAFTAEDVKRDIALFQDKVEQYMFISSAAAYKKPPINLPVTEDAEISNPDWAYARNKVEAEMVLKEATDQTGFPVTIIRPAHTYDETLIPMYGAYTFLDRLKTGRKVVVHGDGTSLWTLTSNQDFAKGFVPLLGNEKAVGEAFNINTDEWLTWNKIHDIFAAHLGVKGNYVYVPSEKIAAYDEEWGTNLYCDRMHNAIFDCSKLKSLVPDFSCSISFEDGAREIVQYYHDNPDKQQVNESFNQLMNRMIAEVS